MKYILFLLIPLNLTAQKFTESEISSWKTQAKNVTIIRDNWGHTTHLREDGCRRCFLDCYMRSVKMTLRELK